MEVHEKIDIEAQQANIMLSNEYEKWLTSRQGEGTFPLIFFDEWNDVLQRNVTNGFVKLESLTLPSIILNINENIDNFAKIFNTDFQLKARVLQLCRVEPEDNITFLPGKYHCFHAQLNIDYQNKVVIDTYYKTNLIKKGHLKLLFDQGKGCIFWNEDELTKGLCLYSSIRSSGRWHDSTQANWKTQQITNNSLLLKGRWKYLPINQLWEFILLEENIIDWKIEMEVLEEINIDREQTNIMLLERYKEWIVINKTKGIFPEFRKDIDDDWHRIWSGCSEAKIGVLKISNNDKFLPSVVFDSFSPEQMVNIVNSDIFFRGRLLQSLMQDRGKVMPGKYHYFSGRIIIDSIR